MAYEILLDDFLAKLSKKGIEEESTTDRLNITKEFVSPTMTHLSKENLLWKHLK